MKHTRSNLLGLPLIGVELRRRRNRRFGSSFPEDTHKLMSDVMSDVMAWPEMGLLWPALDSLPVVG